MNLENQLLVAALSPANRCIINTFEKVTLRQTAGAKNSF